MDGWSIAKLLGVKTSDFHQNSTWNTYYQLPREGCGPLAPPTLGEGRDDFGAGDHYASGPHPVYDRTFLAAEDSSFAKREKEKKEEGRSMSTRLVTCQLASG